MLLSTVQGGQRYTYAEHDESQCWSRFVSKGETTSDGEIKENFFKAEEYEGYKEGVVSSLCRSLPKNSICALVLVLLLTKMLR